MGFHVPHVPYKGSAPAITSLMGGNIDIMFDALPSCMPQAKAGRIVPLAILDNQRFPQLPDVPTMQELGFPGLEAAAWFGVMARRSEEHTSELQSIMLNSYAVYCLQKKRQQNITHHTDNT